MKAAITSPAGVVVCRGQILKSADFPPLIAAPVRQRGRPCPPLSLLLAPEDRYNQGDMNDQRLEHLDFYEKLSLYKPRIAKSRTREAASKLAASFLSGVDGSLGLYAKRTFYEEEAYIWATFPAKARTAKNYRKLVQVLLSQSIDSHWYAAYPRYETDLDINNDETLVSFKRGDADFEAQFDYVRYYEHVFMRLPNSLRLRYRRLVNHPGRYTQGLRTTRCRKAMAGLINQISEDVTRELASNESSFSRGRVFKVMVNSILRTVAYQDSLVMIGYIAPRYSAHLVGYAVDLEKLWYEKHDRPACEAITGTLDELFERGVVNVIEEDTHWHVCLNPTYIYHYETLSQKWLLSRY
jgi:hypothetical protein